MSSFSGALSWTYFLEQENVMHLNKVGREMPNWTSLVKFLQIYNVNRIIIARRKFSNVILEWHELVEITTSRDWGAFLNFIYFINYHSSIFPNGDIFHDMSYCLSQKSKERHYGKYPEFHFLNHFRLQCWK